MNHYAKRLRFWIKLAIPSAFERTLIYRIVSYRIAKGHFALKLLSEFAYRHKLKTDRLLETATEVIGNRYL